MGDVGAHLIQRISMGHGIFCPVRPLGSVAKLMSLRETGFGLEWLS